LENKIAQMYREIDIEAKRMPLSGADSMLKGDIYKRVYDGWVDECKNQEKVKLWEWWEQAESQCSHNQKPVLFISGNHRPILAVMRAEDYFQLRKEVKE